MGEDERIALPVWPKKEFADLNISGEWSQYKSESIDLYRFIEDYIPKMKEDRMEIAIFWLEESGIQVSLDNLKNDIEQELQNYL